MRKYSYEEDDNSARQAFDILDQDKDIIATVASPMEAKGLVRHLNHPTGNYKLVDSGQGNLRFSVVSEEHDETLAVFRSKEPADGILSHLNRKN